ncbi:hypothetical protein SynPROSU1_02184 [Synechococcus sp. PROS-U-1]|nr:hypothetical protein SynPROSU1_02184 [Synechococcus sp. PROS-U-1]
MLLDESARSAPAVCWSFKLLLKRWNVLGLMRKRPQLSRV